MSADGSRPHQPRGSLPVVVIRDFLEQQQQQRDGRSVSQGVGPAECGGSGASNISVPLHVEVETTQGYVYEGRLLTVDEFYNVTLAEATRRRERLCDVERLLLSAHRFPVPGGNPATRREYIGTVLVRSSNLLMVHFPQGEGSAARALQGAFKSMVVKVKRQMHIERQKNRMERRRRNGLPDKSRRAAGNVGSVAKTGQPKKDARNS